MFASSGCIDHPSAGMIGALSSSRTADRLVIAALMAAYIASAVFGGSGYDGARDVAEAFAIRHLQAFPLHGTSILGGALYLGPVWFYLLALPLAVLDSWLGVALFVGVLCSLQFPLAYATGRRLLDRRLGLLWCALLALPGWGTFELVGFSHTNAVRVTTMLVRLAQERRATVVGGRRVAVDAGAPCTSGDGAARARHRDRGGVRPAESPRAVPLGRSGLGSRCTAARTACDRAHHCALDRRRAPW